MHLIKCLFLLQQICQLNAARRKNSTTKTIRAETWARHKGKLLFRYAHTHALRKTGKIPSTLRGGGNMWATHQQPHLPSTPLPAVRRQIGAPALTHRSSPDDVYRRGRIWWACGCIPRQFGVILGASSLQPCRASIVLFQLAFTFYFCFLFVFRFWQLELGLDTLGIRLEWHIIWWCFSRFFRTWVADFY